MSLLHPIWPVAGAALFAIGLFASPTIMFIGLGVMAMYALALSFSLFFR